MKAPKVISSFKSFYEYVSGFRDKQRREVLWRQDAGNGYSDAIILHPDGRTEGCKIATNRIRRVDLDKERRR